MAEVITVSALNRYVKRCWMPTMLCLTLPCAARSQILYRMRAAALLFSLRDEASSVKAVMFRADARRLAFRPEEGMRVVVRCRATLYERDGVFQLYVNDMFPDGIGAAQLALEQLKAKLEQEGLFAPEHKSRCRNFLNASVLLPARRELPCRTSAMCSHGAGHRYGCCCVR